jgi:hypothetical protein
MDLLPYTKRAIPFLSGYWNPRMSTADWTVTAQLGDGSTVAFAIVVSTGSRIYMR